MPSSSTHRQKFVGCKTTTVQSGYVGDIKENLREGYGVYTYPNSFFRYEGEWNKGLKHGYGKLKMRDGSYYEGVFLNGEIDGSGVRYWAYTNNLYEGDFLKGELDGIGIMKYGDGSTYEGGWSENKREGEGTLHQADGSSYYGSFHLHKKHGEGKQVESDGGEYEGGWINDMKHGHGTMKYADGSIYEGQWRGDKMNGEGYLIHSSQLFYEGMWINGRPSMEASKLFIVGDKMITVDQNEVIFHISVECHTIDDEVATESGRLLKISAGISVPQEKIPSASSKSSAVNNQPSKANIPNVIPNVLSELNSNGIERRTTPFGFDVEVYPVCVLDVTTDKHEENRSPVIEKSSSENGSPIVDENPVNCYNNEHVTFNTPTRLSPDKFRDTCDEQRNQSNGNSPVNGQALTNIDLPTVQPQRTSNGQTTFRNLTLPYIPYILARSSLCLSRESADSRGGNKNRKVADSSAMKLENKKKVDNDKADQRENSGSTKKRKTPKQQKQEEKNEDVLNEYNCKPGDYVIIIEDITESPFLDITLEPAYIHVKVQLPVKRSISKIEKK